MRIPMGNFGMAEPTPTQSGVVRDPGSADLQALAQLGSTVSQVGLNEIEKQRREQEKAALEQQRIAKAQEAERKQAQARADRAATITAEIRAQNGIADLGDQVAAGLSDGSITPDDARKMAQTQGKALIDQHLKDVPEDYRGILQAQSEGWTGKLSNAVEDRIRDRNRQVVSGKLSEVGEELQRAARRDINGATKKFEDIINTMGPQAGLKPEQIQETKQRFREQTRYTQAYDLMNQAGDNLKSLGDLNKRLTTDEFDDIDPQRRAAMESSIQSRIATLENRSAIRQQAAMNRAESAYKGFAQFMDGGRMPTQEYTQDIISRVKGTPYESAVMETLKQAPQSLAFSSAPLPQQKLALQQMLTQMNTDGSTPEMEAAYRKREQMANATQADIDRDPINAALERNVIKDVPPMNPADIQGMPAQIAQRQGVVSRVSQFAGRQVSPFSAPEADALGATLGHLPPEQKATALKTLATAMPPAQMVALSQQLGQKNADLAIAAGLTLRDTTKGRNVGELYLKGKAAIAEGRVKIDTAKETGAKAHIFEELNGVYSSPQATQAAADAAYAVYAQMKTEGSDDLNRAIRLATGGVFEHAGGKIAKPYGWTDDRFDDWLKSATPAAIGADKLMVNGVPVSGAEMAYRLPGARLRTVGDGRYLIESGADVVRLPDGMPYILTVK